MPASTTMNNPNRTMSLLPLPNGPLATTEESRSFDFFRRRTVPQLAGVFNADFWDTILLQATHHNETVRHAVFALGALHERFEACDPSILCSNKEPIQGGFALREYLKAIRSLVNAPRLEPASGTQVDIYLVACLLFAAFEVSWVSETLSYEPR